MNEQSAAITLAAVLPPEHLMSYVNEQRLPAAASSPILGQQQVPHRLAQATIARPSSDTPVNVSAGVNVISARHGSLIKLMNLAGTKPTKSSKSKDGKK